MSIQSKIIQLEKQLTQLEETPTDLDQSITLYSQTIQLAGDLLSDLSRTEDAVKIIKEKHENSTPSDPSD